MLSEAVIYTNSFMKDALGSMLTDTVTSAGCMLVERQENSISEQSSGLKTKKPLSMQQGCYL